jgi:diadenosine tetraphosphate (Ap4A) HIT family hydrolase
VRHDALCPFCEPEGAVLVNELAFARYDKYPVTPGYLLIM